MCWEKMFLSRFCQRILHSWSLISGQSRGSWCFRGRGSDLSPIAHTFVFQAELRLVHLPKRSKRSDVLVCCGEAVVHFEKECRKCACIHFGEKAMVNTVINRPVLANRKYVFRDTSDFYGFTPWQNMKESLLIYLLISQEGTYL